MDSFDCSYLSVPEFANNEYKTWYSEFVRESRSAKRLNKAAKVNYALSFVLFTLSLFFMVFANWYIRGIH